MPIRLKIRYFKVVMRPEILCQVSAIKKMEQRMNVLEKKLFRWMCEIIIEVRIRNKYARESVGTMTKNIML